MFHSQSVTRFPDHLSIKLFSPRFSRNRSITLLFQTIENETETNTRQTNDCYHDNDMNII